MQIGQDAGIRKGASILAFFVSLARVGCHPNSNTKRERCYHNNALR